MRCQRIMQTTAWTIRAKKNDDAYMTHVSPGKKEAMVWQFTKAGEFNYACLVPGHFEAGMIGKIKVAAK